MIIMLCSMIVLQQTGLIHPDIMLFIGLMSSCFYNILKSYVIDYIIEFRHQDTIELQGPNQVTLAITLGQLHHTSSPTPSVIHDFTSYSMIAKTLVPIIAILLSQALPPGFILVLSSSSLAINTTEEYLKRTSAENLALNPSWTMPFKWNCCIIAPCLIF